MSDVQKNRPVKASLTDDHQSPNDAGLVLHAERVVTGEHERREAGQIRLRKRIVVEEVTVTLPVRREVVDVVRVDADGTETVVDPAAATFEARVEDRRGGEAQVEHRNAGGDADSTRDEDARVVTCYEERPVVTTETFAVERVRLDTVREVETETIAVELSHEEAELLEDGPRR